MRAPLASAQIESLKKLSSPSVANAIETFDVRPRQEGNLSSEVRALFPEMGPMVGYAVTALRDQGSSSFTTLMIRAARALNGVKCRPTSTRRWAASAW